MPLIETLVSSRPWISASSEGWVPDGWTTIVLDLMDEFGDLVAGHRDVLVQIVDAKEKLGTLRLRCWPNGAHPFRRASPSPSRKPSAARSCGRPRRVTYAGSRGVSGRTSSGGWRRSATWTRRPLSRRSPGCTAGRDGRGDRRRSGCAWS